MVHLLKLFCKTSCQLKAKLFGKERKREQAPALRPPERGAHDYFFDMFLSHLHFGISAPSHRGAAPDTKKCPHLCLRLHHITIVFVTTRDKIFGKKCGIFQATMLDRVI
jgi:hypothetical protein